MAPYQIKGRSKPRFQPLAGNKVLNGRIAKKEKDGAQKPEKTMRAFHSALAFRPKQESSDSAPANPEGQQAIAAAPEEQDTIMADAEEQGSIIAEPEEQEAIVTDTPSAAQMAKFASEENEDPYFSLQDVIPRVGLRFSDERKGFRPLFRRWNAEALKAEMKIVHKRHAQSIIAPIFHQATQMLQNGYIGGLEEAAGIWKRFLGKLWEDSVKKWPRRLSQEQFAHFFSILAEARWLGIHVPKNDGEKHGLLVQHISMFLQAADDCGFPWAMGGDKYSESEESGME